ncbi:MAG: tetratricopeptide repeat protein [Pseudomonadota bacterium]|nr:tetratricopeptide repeat protein [Pseudomonadota bacterium]MEC9218254.1 tetratricopeptide repeat protein [Pseudomonadota bacterium]MEC9300287.1 tetratricopeptide repeat protein [Pseudomonadota bacterium]MED5530119.1 tetratricopeptide repeat protein [Pseudomonadota bacterium]MEE3238996.1 tetratricopeptide repeat protein [Pseudomonadota bacterium]
MALDAAEEENIEALKKWWDENGKPLLFFAIFVIGGYGAWLLWQNSQATDAETASDLYEEVLSLAISEPGLPVTEQESLRILELFDQLKVDYSGSVYALYGALFAAQQLVNANDLDAAEDSLQWVLDNQKNGLFSQTDEGLILTTNLRLGRVILAKGESERALNLVNGIDPKAFEAGFAELRGDIYVTMGRIVDARDAYIAAQQAGSSNDGLRMKLDDLADGS